MKRMLMVFGATASLTLTAWSQSKLTGTWDLSQVIGDFRQGEAAIVESDGKFTLLARFPSAKWVVAGEGKVSGTEVTVEKGHGKFESLQGFKCTFDGDRRLTPAKPGDSAALRLSSLYVCGNHSPSNHVATGLSEMKRLTERHKCERWRPSDSDKKGSAELVKRMLEMPASNE